MRIALALLCAAFLAGCNTPYGSAGATGGVRVFELSRRKIEIIIVAPHHVSYDLLAQMWYRKAREQAMLRGVTQYDIASFSTGREMFGQEIMGEGSILERYSEDTVFWLPKVARGVIELPDNSGYHRTPGRLRNR